MQRTRRQYHQDRQHQQAQEHHEHEGHEHCHEDHPNHEHHTDHEDHEHRRARGHDGSHEHHRGHGHCERQQGHEQHEHHQHQHQHQHHHQHQHQHQPHEHEHQHHQHHLDHRRHPQRHGRESRKNEDQQHRRRGDRRNSLLSSTILAEHGRIEHIFDVIQLCKEHGEGNVDIRDTNDLIAAAQEGRLHVLIDPETDEIVGCVSIYTYMAGDQQFNELGTLILRPAYRELGMADFMVIFSCIYSMLADPGSICVSELYHGSFRAKAVLERVGFRQVVPCHWRVRHAAVSSRGVIHMELGDEPVPAMARKLLAWVDGAAVTLNGVQVHVRFGSAYWLNTEAGREVLRRLAEGDFGAIRKDDEDEAPSPPESGSPHPPGPPSGRRSGSR